MFVIFFKNMFLKNKHSSNNIFDIQKLIQNTIRQMSTFNILRCTVFDIFRPKSKITIIVEKLAIFAALFEVVAVLCEVFKYRYYETVIYGSLYTSVLVTIFLPIAKWFDYKIEFAKLKSGVATNPFDRALLLSLLFGACSVIGKQKMLEYKDEKKTFFDSARNIFYNFWHNTKIYGNFFNIFEEFFGKGSFEVFLEKIDDINFSSIELEDIHGLVGYFFKDMELWENRKVMQAVRILNYKSSRFAMLNNKDIIQSIDYILLSYFKYGKSDIMHEIEAIYTMGRK